jgi:glyceraldehyde-3-phosphate dehydrogenase (NADP+)
MNNLNKHLINLYPDKHSVPDNIIINPVEQKKYLISGEILSWDGNKQTVYSPIFLRENNKTEQVYLGSYPMLSENESKLALKAAVNAYQNGTGEWPTMTVENRIKHIEQFLFEMIEIKTEVVNLLMWEIGKSYRDSLKEFDRTVEYIRNTIVALKELDRSSSRFQIEEGIIGQIRRAPMGVVLCMGPFNYPLNETFTLLIPALIMGNTTIFKPPKYGVLLHSPFLELFQKHFPAGVVNTVYGDGPTIIGPLMTSGQINVLAFIGSSKVANILQKQHPMPNRCRNVLGLEAKNAGIILEDADIEFSVQECITGSLTYNGQRCTALKVIFIHQSIAEEFLNRLDKEISRLKFGMPWEKDVFLTPLPGDNTIDYLTNLIEDATQNGAQVVNDGGGSFNHSFLFPSVLYPVNPKMRIYHEEQFGPVVPVIPFAQINEPLEYIENSNYGQQVSIFGHNPDVIAKLIDPLVNQVCRVNLNSQCQRGPDSFPFTGRKDSAEGTLSVSDALRAFSIRTLVATKENILNTRLINEILREHKSNFLNTDFIF